MISMNKIVHISELLVLTTAQFSETMMHRDGYSAPTKTEPTATAFRGQS